MVTLMGWTGAGGVGLGDSSMLAAAAASPNWELGDVICMGSTSSCSCLQMDHSLTVQTVLQ